MLRPGRAVAALSFARLIRQASGTVAAGLGTIEPSRSRDEDRVVHSAGE
jgi:hypothetical protein